MEYRYLCFVFSSVNGYKNLAKSEVFYAEVRQSKSNLRIKTVIAVVTSCGRLQA